MKKLIRFFLHHPVAVVMALLTVGIFGGISAIRIDTDFLPRIESRCLIVSASHPGLPAGETRDMITIPLEDALSSVGGIRKMISVSKEGHSLVKLEFHWRTDMDVAASETKEVIDIAYTGLPSRTGKPTVLPVHGTDNPVLRIGVFPQNSTRGIRELDLLRRLCDGEIKARLQRVEGVGAVTVTGGFTEEVLVLVDGRRAANRGLSLSYLHEIIKASNTDYPAGTLTEGDVEYLVKTRGKAENLPDLAAMPIPLPGGSEPVLLKDIADVRKGRGKQESFFAAPRGEGIGLAVRCLEGFSPTDLSDNVRREVGEIRKSYGDSLDILVLKDASLQVTRSVRKLLLSAGIGCGIAFGVMLLFLKNPAYASILTLNFPVSILFCLIGLQVFERSLNLMSAGGLVIGIGMLVDNGIIVVENLQKKVPRPGRRGETEQRVAEAAAEMASPAFGATCTTVIVFLPVAFLPGMIGVLYSDLAFAVIFSLAGSYLCSVVMIPVFYFFLLRKQTPPGCRAGRIEKIYSHALTRAFRRPLRLLPLILGLLVTGVAGVRFVSFRLLPPVRTGEFEITVPLEPGVSMERIKDAGERLRAYLEESEDVGGYFVHAGGSRNDIYYLSKPAERRGIIHCTAFVKRRRGIDDRTVIGKAVRDLTSIFPKVSVKTPRPLIAPLLGIDEDTLTITVSGEEESKLHLTAGSLISRITELAAGYEREDFSTLPEGASPAVRISLRRDRLSGAGISLKRITREAFIALTGSIPSKMRIDGRELDVRLRLEKGERITMDELEKIVMLTPKGEPAALGSLAEIEHIGTGSSFFRENRKDTVYINAPLIHRSSPAFGKIKGLLHETENAAVSGSSVIEEQKREIGFLFLLALLLIYLLLGAQFESLLLPLVIVLPVLPAFSGVIAALALTGNSLDMNSALGVIVFLGVGVNNSIILSESYRKAVRRETSFEKAILRGSTDRIRPILMTMLTTVTALIPTAVYPLKRSRQIGMSSAVIGGLAVAVAITLFIQPHLFLALYRFKENLLKRTEKKRTGGKVLTGE